MRFITSTIIVSFLGVAVCAHDHFSSSSNSDLHRRMANSAKLKARSVRVFGNPDIVLEARSIPSEQSASILVRRADDNYDENDEDCDDDDDDDQNNTSAVQSSSISASSNTSLNNNQTNKASVTASVNVGTTETKYDASNNTSQTYVAPSVTTTAVSSVATSTSRSGNSGDYQGMATFFYQGGNAGACGTVHADSDLVVAIDSAMYADGKLCGKTVTITRVSTGKKITAKAADMCPTCVSSQSLDLSLGAYLQLGTEDEGTFPIMWSVDY